MISTLTRTPNASTALPRAAMTANDYQVAIGQLMPTVLSTLKSPHAETLFPNALMQMARELHRLQCPESELRRYFQGRNGGDKWLKALADNGVFATLRGTALSEPNKTPLAPQETPERLAQQNPLSLLKAANRSFIWVGASGTGKTTGMQYLVHKLFEFDPLTHFVILDMQAAQWGGLAQYEHTVIFLAGAPEQVVAKAAAYIGWVAEQLEERIVSSQAQARLRKERWLRSPLWLVINEWPRIFRFWSTMSATQRESLGAKNLLNNIITILCSGREENVGLVISCHNHNKEAIGLGPNDYASATLIASGRVDIRSREGGYDSLVAAIRDSRLIRDEEIREQLYRAFLEAKRGYPPGSPLVALINGEPMVGYNAIDPAKLNAVNISQRYQHQNWKPPWVIERERKALEDANRNDLGEELWGE